MATPATLDGMISVGADSGVKPLGFIVWFSVPDENVSLRRLRRIWQLAGLDPSPLPKDQKAVNVFKRAIRELEGRVNEAGVITETTVADVLENEQDVIYQISRVVRDLDEQVVEYPKAMRVVFSKVTEDIHYKPLGGVTPAEVLPMMDAIQNYYDANTKTVTGAKVRTLVRNYIKNDSDEQANLVGLAGENMRGKAGGVYFVFAKHKAGLDSLAEMLDELYAGSRAYLYTVPMADGASERELIRRHHTANTLADIKEAMADAAKLIRADRDRGVRSNVADHHWARLQRLRTRAAHYALLLKDEEAEIETAAAMLERQLKKLI